MRHSLRVKQRPNTVGLDTFHKQIGYPICQVQIMRAAGIVAGVVAEFEKILDVGMPCFEIYTACAFSLAALIYRRDAGIESLKPRNDTIRMAICSANERPS